jgi:hypothetical protein
MRLPLCAQLEQAAKLEYAARLRSANTKEAITAFFEKRKPDFNRKSESATAAQFGVSQPKSTDQR